MSNFWEEDVVSEYDMISEDVENSEAIAESIVEEMEAEEPPELVEASEEQIEQILDQSAYDLNEKETNVVFNARLRLEQAKLYEMLINHSLFAGVDASDDAKSVVENELKHFIVKRLEILLGIRKPKVRQVETELSVELPFNATEVDFLKQLAYKGTLGKSATNQTPTQASVKPTLNPLVGSVKQNAIKPLQQRTESKPQEQVVLKPSVATPKVKQKPAKNNIQAKPVKNQPKENKPKISSGGHLKRELSKAEAEEIAKADLEALKNKKPFNKLKAKEKIERIKEVNEKYKRKQASGGQHNPTAKELEMEYLTREANGRNAVSVLDSMAKTILNSKRKIRN